MAKIVEIETEIEQGDFTVDREGLAKAREQFDLFRELYTNKHRDYMEQAERHDRFYRGDQWDEHDLQVLKAAGRPALTLNMILSTINTFLGEQISRRIDIQYKPHKEEAKDAAHALSAVAMAVLSANQYDWRETEMVEDGVIRDRGYLNFRVSFDKNMQGEVEITNLHPDNVILEPNTNQYDPAEWPGVMVATWDTLDEIEARFGKEKRDEVEKAALVSSTFGVESVRFAMGDDREDGPRNPWDLIALTEETKRQIKSIRVIDRQFYKNVRVYVLVDPETNAQRELKPGISEKEARALAKEFGVFLRAKVSRRLYWRVTADQVVLWEGWSPYKTPTVIPYFPYFRKGEIFGIVKNLLSPQEQYNKVSSQELHIVNSTANGGWKVKRGALLNMTPDDLAQRGSQTGVVLELNDLNGAEKILPNSVPTGISSIKRDSQMAVRSIAGMSDSFVGADGQEVSGVAMKSKEKRGQVQIQKPLDNLARTRYLVGRKILELLQSFYTDARVMMTVDFSRPGMPEQEIEINMPQEDGTILNHFSEGEFSTQIATMPSRESYDDSQFAEILNMRSVGVMIPDYHVVQYSHLQQKAHIAEELKAMAGLQAPTEEEQEMQQIQMQLALQEQMAALQEKEAKVNELMTRAQLNSARAEKESTEDERELRKQMLELQQARESFRVRLQLAQMQGVQKLDTTALKGQNDVIKAQIAGAQRYAETNRQL